MSIQSPIPFSLPQNTIEQILNEMVSRLRQQLHTDVSDAIDGFHDKDFRRQLSTDLLRYVEEKLDVYVARTAGFMAEALLRATIEKGITLRYLVEGTSGSVTDLTKGGTMNAQLALGDGIHDLTEVWVQGQLASVLQTYLQNPTPDFRKWSGYQTSKEAIDLDALFQKASYELGFVQSMISKTLMRLWRFAEAKTFLPLGLAAIGLGA